MDGHLILKKQNRSTTHVQRVPSESFLETDEGRAAGNIRRRSQRGEARHSRWQTDHPLRMVPEKNKNITLEGLFVSVNRLFACLNILLGKADVVLFTIDHELSECCICCIVTHERSFFVCSFPFHHHLFFRCVARCIFNIMLIFVLFSIMVFICIFFTSIFFLSLTIVRWQSQIKSSRLLFKVSATKHYQTTAKPYHGITLRGMSALQDRLVKIGKFKDV